MTDKCACCGQPATRKISGGQPILGEFEGHPYTNYVCDDCLSTIMSSTGFAAGQWLPIWTAPLTEDETILIKDDDGSVYTAVYWKADKWCTWGSDGHHSVIQKSEIIAWARINTQEETK